jgi:hypothetical protein
MRRRELIALLAGAATWPLPLRAEQAAPRPRIGVLLYSTPQADPNTGSCKTSVLNTATQKAGLSGSLSSLRSWWGGSRTLCSPLVAMSHRF